MKIPLALLLILTISGCATQRRCAEKWPLQDSVAWHDTIYYVSLKTDTVFKWGTIRDTVYASTGTAGGSAWVINDTIYLNVWQKDTVIEYRDSIKTIYERQIVPVPCKKTPVLNKILIIALVLLVIIGLLKFVR